MSRSRRARATPVDPASCAAAAVLQAVKADAVVRAEATYAAGPGARKRPRPACQDEERRARKTKSAYLSRFTASAYTVALEAACATAAAERVALEAEVKNAKEEKEALQWAVLCAENELLRRSVGELQAAVDGDMVGALGGAMRAAEEGNEAREVAVEWAWAPAPVEVSALSDAPVEDLLYAEERCAGQGTAEFKAPLSSLPCSPMSGCESAESDADVRAEIGANADEDALFRSLLSAKEGEWEFSPLPDADLRDHVYPIRPASAA